MKRRSVVTPCLIGFTLVANGCADKPANCLSFDNCVIEETGSSGTEVIGDGDGDGDDGNDDDWGDPQLPINKDVDILFVIDNSGSMGEEQAILAANVGSFINVLEQKGVEANYRIGITTTDNGNPWCPAGQTTPEGGKLVLSSCKTRLNDFLFADIVDVRDLACNDICQLSAAELEILPTTTDLDATPSPRPWLEHIEGKKNIPAGTSTADAFKCFGPQGVNGCGFESPLESMYLALTRALTNAENSYGFLRANAILAVVFLTDEADCSYNKNYSSIFAADGNKVFWSDPNSAYPTSAVCWNAGVECYGDPSNYETCDPVDKDVNGFVTDSPSAAVLHPMSRYVGLLQGLEQDKQQLNPDQDVIVALIGGVNSMGEPFYADVDNTDPAFQDSFGIGPGCTAPNPLDPGNPITAVPPVRLRDLTEEFAPGNMFSICNSDYSPALEAIADRIKDQFKPACFQKCVADTDTQTPVIEPQCTVTEDPPGPNNEVIMAECQRDAGGYVIDAQTGDYAMPSANVNACYALLVDPGGLTADPNDDMSSECLANGYNLQFEIARRPGFPAVGGTSIGAECLLSDSPQTDCPGIGGG